MTYSPVFRRIRISLLIVVGIILPLFALLPIRYGGLVTNVIGSSMDPTLHSGQMLFGLPVKANPLQEVQRGDIVTLDTHHEGKVIIKRVIALPGDRLEIRNNQVYVNGTALQEDYIAEPMRTRDIPALTLAEDQYFVLGDNRNVSADSRYYGLFSRSDIVAVTLPQFTILPYLVFFGIIGTIVCLEMAIMDQLDEQRHQDTACAVS